MEKIDYWQEGINFINKNKYEEGINSYKKAIENGNKHPFLYSNIADAYNSMGDSNNALIWYNIAIDKLLNLEEPHSGNPYYWTANFYYENKIFNDKVIKLIKKALEFFPKDSNTIILYVNIILESKIACKDSVNDAILKLSWIEVFESNHEESKKLRKKYKKEIKKNLSKLEEEKKEDIIEILDERKTSLESKNYILTGNGDISKMKIKMSAYERLHNNIPLKIGSEYMLRAFRIYLNNAPSHAYEEVRAFVSKNTQNVIEVINIMVKLTNNVFEVINKVIENELYSNEDNKITENKLSNELIKLIFPKYENEIVLFYENKKNEYIDYFWVKILLDYNYDKYIGVIKKKLLNLKQYNIDNEMKILEYIKDENFIDDYFLKRVNKFTNKELKEEIQAYLRGEKIDLSKLNIKSLNIYSYYKSLLGNITRTNNLKNKTLKKLVKFGELLNYIDLYDLFFLYNSDKQIKNFIKEYDLSVFKVASWVFYIKDIGGYDYSYNYPFTEKLIMDLAKKNIEDVIKAFNNAKPKGKSEYLSSLFKINNEKFLPVVIQLVNDKSKVIKETVFNILKRKKVYRDSFWELINSKKQDVRVMGVKLIISLKDKNDYDLLKEIYYKDNSEKVKLEIEKYMGNTDFLAFDSIEKIKRDENIDLYGDLLENSLKFTPKGKREPVPGVKLFNVATLPKLKFNNSNKELGIEVSYYMLNFYARSKEIEGQLLANEAIKLFDKTSLNNFAQEIYYRWGFDAKTKWIFSLIAGFTNEDFISGLGDKFIEMGESRKSVLMRKLLEHFNLFKDLSIVKELEIIVLRDRRAMISNSAIIELERVEKKNKKTRNQLIDLYVRDNKYDVTYQKERLESILYIPHFWKFSDWKKQFIDKKFLNIFAQNLIWGVYDENDKLLLSFRADENNLLIDVGNNEVKLSNNDIITLLHPVELSNENYKNWNEHISDYEIIQPLKQISIGRYIPQNLNDNNCEPAKGFFIKRGVLRRFIYKAGWDKGDLLDHGDYDTYIKHMDNGFIAEIRFDGDASSHDFFDDNESIRLYELKFSKFTDYKLKSNIFFKNLPLRLYSSVYNDIQNVLKKGWKE